MKDVYIFAIESSCDETSCAIVKNGTDCIGMSILSQISVHTNFGGVVPEIASRLHTENITMVIDDCLNKAGMKLEEMDAFAVTYAPGLLGSLLVGLECTKTLSLVYNKPLIAVNHIAGHIYANNLNNKMEFPLLALVVSGGHTETLLMNGDYDFKILGKTLDDALGECYDKVARVLDIPYPGGPNLEKLALEGKPTYKLNIPMNDDSYNFSFSGLKSNVINLVHNEKQKGNEINRADLACSFQSIAINEIKRKVELVLKNYDIKNMLIAGGVSANKYLRGVMEDLASEYKVKLSVPEFIYCTDNAGMIGAAAYPMYLKGEFASLNINANSVEEVVK